MNYNEEFKVEIIPPINSKEASKIMQEANKDVKDAERVFNGENSFIVRRGTDKDFNRFCKDYKSIKLQKED